MCQLRVFLPQLNGGECVSYVFFLPQRNGGSVSVTCFVLPQRKAKKR